VESSDVHRVNAGLVLRALVTAGATSRQQIVRETTLGKATVSRVVRDLIDSGLVVEGSLVKGPDGGRATRTLEFRGGQELVCGVDMGGTNTRLVVVDQRAGLVAAWRQPTAHLAGGPNIADWLVDALHAGCPDVVRHGLAATVVGVPGAVVPGSGEIAQAPNLTEVEGTGFARRLGELLPGHVAVRNDSNLALVGEMGAGAAAGFHDVAMITVGTGVGTGVAVGGELLTGARGLIGEFGSLPIALDGTVVEDVLGGDALTAARTALGCADGALPLSPRSTDTRTRATLRGQIVGAVYAVCVAMSVAYDLDMIVFGGRGSASLGEALEQTRKRLSAALPAAPELVASRLGDGAGALGAVALGLDQARQQLGAGAAPTHAQALGRELRALATTVVDRLETGRATATPAHPAVR